ncbi:MAG TPA: nicotinate phosphoribosyltransferase, partial [Bacilli bacterium]|nr:nicotinate phosphoribosyltransferase [Bacilli bacterium]
LITSKSSPVLDGVYKLVAIEEDGKVIPKIKISENIGKITTPHFKKIYRLYENDTKKALADVLTVYDEVIPRDEIEIFDPEAIWKRKVLTNYHAEELLIPIFKDGKQVYKLPNIEDIKAYCAKQLETLWDEVTRFENPHNYYVDFSQKLWDVREELLDKNKGV